jgi:uncharacterized protein (TIGR03000 family)
MGWFRTAVFAPAALAMFLLPGSRGEAQKPARTGRPAVVIVHVRPDARLTAEGLLMRPTGEVRRLETPPLTPGVKHKYDLKATWQDDGRERSRAARVEFEAGQVVVVDLRPLPQPAAAPVAGELYRPVLIEPPAAPAPPAADWSLVQKLALDDSEFMLVANLAQIAGHPWVKDRFGAKIERVLQEQMGGWRALMDAFAIDPLRDIHTCVATGTALSPSAKHAALVFHGRFHRKQILQALRQVELAGACRRHAPPSGLEEGYYEFQTDRSDKAPVFLAVLGDHALAISPNAGDLEELLRKDAGQTATSFRNPAFPQALPAAGAQDGVWMAALGQAVVNNSGDTLEGKGVESFHLGLRLDDRLAARLTATMKDGYAPAPFAAQLQFDLLRGKGALMKASQERSELAPVVGLVEDLIQGIDVAVDGQTFTLETTADLDLLPADWADGENAVPLEHRELYRRLLRSVVWVVDAQTGVTGAGVVLLPRNRLVLTCHHVVQAGGDVAALFPIYKNGQVVAEREPYLSVFKTGKAVHGRVIAADRRRDLALIRLDTMPDDVQPLPPAQENAFATQVVHSLGNPNVGALWVYTRGAVRQVVRRKAADPGAGIALDARVILTDSPINPGDSGGPLVNGQGELLGITHGYLRAPDNRVQRTSLFIDLSEIEAFLREQGYKLP